MKKNKDTLSFRRLQLYQKNAEVIKFLRRNPIIACEELLGIKLMDSQKYILQSSWNATNAVWCCSRNFGKSFLGAVFMLLKAILYENQGIYIVSSVGAQAQETFNKIEEIVLRIGQTSNSIDSLLDIVKYEVVTSPACKTGFVHAQTGYRVEFYNGSEIITLNGNPDRNRSRRATLVFFDESGFCSEELIVVCEAFATQDTNFKTSTRQDFDFRTLKKKTPTQLIYASSASHVDSIFYRKYRDFAIQMYLGNKNYFCADIPCDIPLNPLIDGKSVPPLLQQSKVDSAMRTNRDKAIREYYNKFMKDGGEGQIIKWAQIRRNETLLLPELSSVNSSKYAIAFDPARTADNSIVMVMKVVHDENIGYYGEIVNCTNLIELGNKKGYKMKTPDQIDFLKKTILAYNGNAPDYENILGFLIDPGAGGGGISAYGDNLLDDWKDEKDRIHKGFLDKNYDLYQGYETKYPNASDILKFLSPSKYRSLMVENTIELMKLDLLKFTKEYDGKGFVSIQDENSNINKKYLSLEEEVALVNMDILKTEMTSIYKFENAEGTSRSYKLPKDKEKVMNDDRFYALIMLGHFLYELRRQDIVNKEESSNENDPLVYY